MNLSLGLVISRQGKNVRNNLSSKKYVFHRSYIIHRALVCNTENLVQNRKLSYWNVRKLPRLETEANNNPNNAAKQAEFLKLLNKTSSWEEVLMRVNSGKYAMDAAVKREYIKALVATDRLDSVELGHIGVGDVNSASNNRNQFFGTFNESYSNNNNNNNSISNSNNSNNNNNNNQNMNAGGPIPVSLGGDSVVVEMKEPSLNSQIWRMIRITVGVVIGYTALSAIMEEKGLKGDMSRQIVEPQQQTRKFKFDDIKGIDEAKEDLEEIVQFLKNPEKFTRLGGKLPKGVLLVGPPGTGKTLLARAIAGEADVPFFYCSGSEFDEMFVGVGARRVRDLFAAAKRKQPCIIFIDEIDGVGGSRNPRDPNYTQMTLNQLLVELDGFSQNDGVIVVGATNFPEMLDKALVRPGRFDKHVNLPLPDIKGREEILKVHTKDIPFHIDADLRVIARNTQGLSGAELANIINQAALKASVEGKREVQLSHLEFARDKIIMGAERKSSVVEESCRRSTAFHEGGHALVAIHTLGAMPVHKATIMPRGRALGFVMQLPENDMLSWSKQQLLAAMDVCMGGRVAEEIIFGADQITTGASNDLEKATSIARSMIMKYGMNEKIGKIAITEDDKLSSESKAMIEDEIRILCQKAYENAKSILVNNEKQLHKLAEALMENETLNADEIYQAIGVEKKKGKN